MMFKKRFLKILRPLGILLLAILSHYSHDLYDLTGIEAIGKLNVFESKFYDFRNEDNLTRPREDRKPDEINNDIFLVKIDDSSLGKLGVWPLPRTIYADLLKQLAKYDVKVVAFDVLFPEKSPPYAGINPDVTFRKSLEDFVAEKRSVVLSYSLVNFNLGPKGELISDTDEQFFETFPEDLYLNTVNSKENKEGELEPSGISVETYPIAEFIEPGSNLGFISSGEDPDGIFRKYKAIAKSHSEEGVLFDSLGLISYLEWSKERDIFADFYVNATGQLRSGLKLPGGQFLELDRQGNAKLRYIGAEEAFQSFSLYDVLHPDEATDRELRKLAGKIVFVGSTANGAHDLRPTPVSAKMAGVYAHMNFVHMLSKRHLFQKSETSILISLVFLFLGMSLFLFLHRFENAVLDLVSLIVLIAGSYYVDVTYLMDRGYELKLFTCYLCFLVTYLWNTFLNFYEANKEKRQIRGTFARYVAPTVVDEMLKDPENIQVGGTRKDITCLFSDVRDFTSISESLSAQELANVLNDYMNRMTDIVFDTKGTLDKYIGDAIVAIWGAPVSIGNHAQYAVEAALRMAEAMPALNEEFRQKNFPVFHVGIGLNTGECSVGNMGSTRIFSYTALGDNMNLGARLEGLCKYYGTQILISENTLARLEKDSVKARPIDKVIVKGRTQAVAIFEVISKVHPMAERPELFQLYLSAHLLYSQKNFRGAVEIFDQILTGIPEDKPTKRLKSVCEKYLDAPDLVTDEFDVTKMTEK